MPAIAYHDRPPSHLDQARAEIKRLPQHARSYLRGMFPIIDWLPKYNLGWFYGDVICAVTIGTIIIPQSMAYAKMAGFPPQYGLYCSFIGLAIYPFLGTSKDISIGATAIMSLMVGQIHASVKATAEYASGEWTSQDFAVTIALFSGVIVLALSVLRLGILFNFICRPVIVGFLAGSGLTIVITQIAKIMGIPNIDTTAAPYLIFGRTLIHLNETGIDAVFGLLSLIWLYGVKYGCNRLMDRYPQHKRKLFYFSISRSVIVLVVTTFLSWVINHFGRYEESPFHILGPIPAGFQLMGVPKIKPGLLSFLSLNLPSIVALMMMEHCAIASNLGKISDYQIDVNQELLSLGITNIFGSFFSAYPATGSFCRTAIAAKSGARTPLPNLVVAAVVALGLYVFTPAFQYIPTSSLAAVIAHGVSDLVVGPQVWRRFWRTHPSDFVIFAAAYLIALFARLDVAVYVPVALSLIVQLYRTARPDYAFLGRQDDMFVPLLEDEHVRPIGPGIVCFQPRENLVFENAAYVFGKLVNEIKRTTRPGKPMPDKMGDRPWNQATEKRTTSAAPELQAIVLDLSGVHQMDCTGMEELKATARWADRHAGHPIHWYIVLNGAPNVYRALLYAGFGTQRLASYKPGYISDLKKRDDEACDNDSSLQCCEEDEVVASDPHLGAVKDDDNKQVYVIEDIAAAESQDGSSNTAQSASDNVDFPYLFRSLQDAAARALNDTQQPPLLNDEEKKMPLLDDEEKKIGH